MEKQAFSLAVDSASDLSEDWVKRNGVFYIPLGTVLEGREVMDDFEHTMPTKKVYEAIRNGAMPTTVQGSAEATQRIFEECCAAGRDVLYVAFSSGLSGTYQNACRLAQEAMERHPGRKVLVLDSLGATLGEGIVAMEALRLRDQGLDVQQAYDQLESKRLKACHFFTVDDLNHLYRGGRLARSSAILGTIVGIKPVMYVSNEGKLTPLNKKRGRRQSMEEMARLTAEYIVEPEQQTIYLVHGDCEDDCRELERMVKERLPGAKTDLRILSPTIGAHSGPGTLAIFFWGKKRKQ